METDNRAPSQSYVTKRSLGWAGIVAFVACAACCALPMLAVAGGGMAASLAALMSPGTELLAAGVVAAATLGFFAVRSARRAKTCGTSCAVDAACCDGRSAQTSERSS